ncbi:MAG: hypothetical protein QM651_12780 [Rhodoblastus sp.]
MSDQRGTMTLSLRSTINSLVARAMSFRSPTVNIRVIAFKGTTAWVAQGLEYDIAAQAPSADELQEEFLRVLTAHLQLSVELGQEPFEGVPRAPQHFFEMFDHARINRHRGKSAKLSVGEDIRGARVDLAFA